MGAVYDVVLKIKYSSEQDVISATKAFVEANSGHARFSDVDYSSIVSAIQIILPKRGFNLNNQTDNSIDCDCGFDASYGWEAVMQDWFDSIAPVLKDGSEFKIYPDNGYYSGIVNNGKVSWSDLEEDDGDLEYALDLINQYLLDEFDHGVADDADLSDIGLMYTTDGGDNEVELEVTADLNKYQINYYVNGELRHTDNYDDLQDMIESELEHWSYGGVFDALYEECLQYTKKSDYDPEVSQDYIDRRDEEI